MITIERAKISDVDEIKGVLRNTWVATYADSLSHDTVERITSDWHSKEALSFQMQNPSIHFFIARSVDTDILGLATVREDSKDAIYMSRLYVLPVYQGQGIGSQLTDHAIKMFPRVKRIRLSVEEMNQKAIEFYLNRGFVKVDERALMIGDDAINTFEMEKVVNNPS
jgi:ribosomal protein S18 acetylase RimI-like enzyme